MPRCDLGATAAGGEGRRAAEGPSGAGTETLCRRLGRQRAVAREQSSHKKELGAPSSGLVSWEPCEQKGGPHSASPQGGSERGPARWAGAGWGLSLRRHQCSTC